MTDKGSVQRETDDQEKCGGRNAGNETKQAEQEKLMIEKRVNVSKNE